MSLRSPSSQLRPKTAAEAEYLMNLAIESGNFEDAKILAEEVKSLKNFESELQLAKTVHGYYTDKQEFSNKMDRNYHEYEHQINEAKRNSEQFFREEFQNLRVQQEEELENVLKKWDNARFDIQGDAEAEYRQTMITAKLLAGRMRFDDAIKLKAEAEARLKSKTRKTTREVDLKFNTQCELLLERQESTIKALVERKNAELKLLDALLDASRSQALEFFLMNNANAILDIAARFPPGSSIPKSLQMQTVRGRPMKPVVRRSDAAEGDEDGSPPPPQKKSMEKMDEKKSMEKMDEKKFMEKMDEIDRIIGYPLKAPIGRAPPGGFQMKMGTIEATKQMNDISELSLTRSPMKSDMF